MNLIDKITIRLSSRTGNLCTYDRDLLYEAKNELQRLNTILSNIASIVFNSDEVYENIFYPEMVLATISKRSRKDLEEFNRIV